MFDNIRQNCRCNSGNINRFKDYRRNQFWLVVDIVTNMDSNIDFIGGMDHNGNCDNLKKVN